MKWCGIMDFPGLEPVRLWTILEPFHDTVHNTFWCKGTTIAEQTLVAANVEVPTVRVDENHQLEG